MEGMAEAKQLVDDFNAISLKFSEDLTEDEMDQVITKQGELQNKLIIWMHGIWIEKQR